MEWSLGGEGGRRLGDTAMGGQLHLGLPGREQTLKSLLAATKRDIVLPGLPL